MPVRIFTRCISIGIALYLFILGSTKGQVKGGYQEFFANSGTTVTLRCYGTHNSYDNITWWKNDSLNYVAERGPGYKYFSQEFTNRLNFVGDSKDLMIFDCQGKDHGFYYCETKYGSEKRRGGYYKFVVEEKPRCRNTISDLNVLVGSSVNLPCLVQGTPKPSIKWTKEINRKDISLGSRFKPSEKGLNIKDARLEDRGTYKVKLKNKIDTYYHSIQLNVRTIDSISKENYYSIELGSDAVLKCVGPLRKGTKITWSTSTGADATIMDRFKADSDGSLSISKVRMSDAGLYTCKKQVPFGGGILKTSTLVYVNVQYIPVITAMKKSIVALNNTDVIIPCEARGNPAPMYKWSFPDGQTVSSTVKHEFYSNGSLIIRNVRTTDVLNYTCTPYNKVGDGKSGHTLISVLVPPRFLRNRTEEIRVRVGDTNVKLDCSVFGIPEPSVSWQFIDKNNKRQVLLSRDGQKIMNHKGLFMIDKISRSDQGIYICSAKSSSGQAQRQIQLKVLDKPQVPKGFTVVTQNKTMHFSWQPGHDGGAKQDYEIWYRSTDKDDYEWTFVSITKTKHSISISDTESQKRNGVTFYCSVRSKNSEGYSEFSYVVKTAKLLERSQEIVGIPLQTPLSTSPLSPNSFKLIIYKNRYELKWRYILTPGRPASQYFLIEYREKNETSRWETFARKRRERRSVIFQDKNQNNLNIYTDDIPGVTHPLKFRVSSVTAKGIKSEAAIPFVTDLSVAAVTGKSAAVIDSTLIPPIVMGVIFSLFTVLIVIGLYCYCERKKKRTTSSKESKASLVPNDNNNTTIDRNSLELRDNSKLIASDEKDMPTRYHFSQCPALKLGENSHPTDSSQPDDVFVLLQPNAGEHAACTCSKKYVTQEQLKLNEKKRSLYKSSSLPSVLFTSDADISSVDPSVDGREFNVLENKKDGSHTLDKDAIARLQRGGLFRDSYDKFCRSGSNSKSPSRAPSTTLPGTEKRSLSKLPETDTSSTATPVVENESILRHGILDDDESPETKSNKSIDGKSSGFGDGDSSTSDPDSIELERLVNESFQHKESLSDSAAAQLLASISNKKDTGYFSDVPTRISPLFINNQKFHPISKNRLNTKNPHSGYFSEDETVTRLPYRPIQPPTYNQAIIDIERMTENPGITDSEVMCNKLIEMQKQMGIKLDDSIENNLDKLTIIPPPPPSTLSRFQNSFLDSGYTSDVSSTLKTRYSNKEKNERCAQLLNEFKIYRKPGNSVDFTEGILEEDLPPPGSTPKHIVGRSISAMDERIPEEMEESPLKRSNSTNSNLFNEWLV